MKSYSHHPFIMGQPLWGLQLLPPGPRSHQRIVPAAPWVKFSSTDSNNTVINML